MKTVFFVIFMLFATANLYSAEKDQWSFGFGYNSGNHGASLNTYPQHHNPSLNYYPSGSYHSYYNWRPPVQYYQPYYPCPVRPSYPIYVNPYYGYPTTYYSPYYGHPYIPVR